MDSKDIHELTLDTATDTADSRPIPNPSDHRETDTHNVLEKNMSDYEQTKKLLENNRRKAQEKIDALKLDTTRKLLEYEQKKGRPAGEDVVTNFQASIIRQEKALQLIEDQLAFLRPRNAADVAYRLQVYDSLAALVETNVPENIPFRFHGAPIYNAKRIIESHELSSTVDRLGIESSYDVADQLSVTTPSNMATTVQGYTSLNELNYQLPAGCIFVLLPKSAEDAASGANSMLMSSVHLDKNPEQLYAVLTSPEMFDRVKDWMQTAKLGTEKVSMFLDFPADLAKLKTASKK